MTNRVSCAKLTIVLVEANSKHTKNNGVYIMMPLTFSDIGEDNIIKRIGGNPETKKHLEDLGFVVGGNVKLISRLGGNVIVNVKEARIAISEEMAQKIMV